MTYIIAYVKTQKNKIHNPLCQTYPCEAKIVSFLIIQSFTAHLSRTFIMWNTDKLEREYMTPDVTHDVVAVNI